MEEVKQDVAAEQPQREIKLGYVFFHLTNPQVPFILVGAAEGSVMGRRVDVNGQLQEVKFFEFEVHFPEQKK